MRMRGPLERRFEWRRGSLLRMARGAQRQLES